MSSERPLDDVVTEILLNTCRPCPPLRSRDALYAAVFCHEIATKSGRPDIVDTKVTRIPLITGSVAEFYIEPILPLFGDIDLMWHYNIELAIPRGHPPPTQLPAEFHNYVQVFEIIDSHLPGYVYLELRYLLTQCSDDGNYNAVDYDREQYLSNRHYGSGTEIHGPAAVDHLKGESALLSVDRVHCIRCLVWPPQAADWPTRHRNYGWPDSAAVERVVSNGCDVVGVAHRQCKQHEWMGKGQWRLSFSRAEIVLINGWIPVQQIVYHMLRVYVKTERLTESTDTFSNYHIKTLMLWACELKSRSWWTDGVSLVRICYHLLHVLATWLTHADVSHYFINGCNLIVNTLNVVNIRDQLMSVNKPYLSTWFMDNYVRKCFRQSGSPQILSRLFDDVTLSMKLHNAVSALVVWGQIKSLFDLWTLFDVTESLIATYVHIRPLTAVSCVCCMNVWTTIDTHLSIYFRAVAFLHVASWLLRHGLNDELMDILATVCGLFTDIRLNSYHSTSALSLNIAATLMKTVASKSLSTMSLIEIEVSKAYLHRALRCKDSDSQSIYCLANVYLAVLYYTTGQFQTAIDQCTLVTKTQDHSLCSLRVVQGKMLPKIYGDIDNVLGLAELYQSVRSGALNQQRQPQLLSVFTTELCAYFLHIKCLSVTKGCQHIQVSSADEFKQYGVCIGDAPQLFIGDVLLYLSLSRLLELRHKSCLVNSKRSQTNANRCCTSDLVKLLQKSAIEQLTTYRQLTSRDFGSVATIVTTDFEALYAYKRNDYQQCLQLSTQNVHTLLYARRMPDVLTFPEFIQLLDDDIVSMTALTLIVSPECRGNLGNTCISQLTLSLYLMTECQLKLHHSVASLAQTLGYIKVAQRKRSANYVLDQLTLKLIEHKLNAHMSTLGLH